MKPDPYKMNIVRLILVVRLFFNVLPPKFPPKLEMIHLGVFYIVVLVQQKQADKILWDIFRVAQDKSHQDDVPTARTRIPPEP